MPFVKNFMKETTNIFTSSESLLSRNILRSGNRWQKNGVHLDNYRNLHKQKSIFYFVCVVYLNSRDEIFNFCSF